MRVRPSCKFGPLSAKGAQEVQPAYRRRVLRPDGELIAITRWWTGQGVLTPGPGGKIVHSKEISILIVEDHDYAREGLATVLGREYTCFTAATAEEAIRLLGARYFNLVLTDIHLPGASGLEVCRLISKMELDTVVIVMTGMRDTEYRTRALGQRALFCIEKPIHPIKLLIWVESALKCQALRRVSQRHKPEAGIAKALPAGAGRHC